LGWFFYLFILVFGAAQAPEKNPQYIQALHEMSARNYETAFHLFKQLSEQYPQNPTVQYNLGAAAFQNKNFLAANLAFTRVWEINPLFPKINTQLLRCAKQLKNWNSIQQWVNGALAENSYEGYYFFAIQKSKEQKFDSAKNAYLKCIELNPEFAPCVYDLGILYMEQSRWDSALYYFQEGRRIEYDNPLFLEGMVACKIQQGHLDSAWNLLTQSSHRSPIMQHYKALLMARQFRWEDAAELMQTLDTTGVFNTLMKINIAAIEMGKGNDLEALRRMGPPDLNQPFSGIIYLNTGIALENLFQPEKACIAYRKASDLGIPLAEKYYKSRCGK
jgi:tetratricopeptide (TPR) repeat protein